MTNPAFNPMADGLASAAPRATGSRLASISSPSRSHRPESSIGPVMYLAGILRLGGEFCTGSDDPVLYAHASRTLHLESNPGNARALVQAHGEPLKRECADVDPTEIYRAAVRIVIGPPMQ